MLTADPEAWQERESSKNRGFWEAMETLTADPEMEKTQKAFRAAIGQLVQAGLPEFSFAKETECIVPGVSLAIRANTVRQGVSGWPLNGIGGFLQSTSNALAVALVPHKTLMDIGMDKLESFDDYLESRKIQKRGFPSAALMVGEMLWIPYGHVPLIVSNEPCASFIFVPWRSAKFKDVPGVAMCRAAYVAQEKKSDMKVWSQFKDYLTCE